MRRRPAASLLAGLLVAGLLSVGLLAACGGREEEAPPPDLPPPPPARVVSLYLAVAFGDRHGAPHATLRRWSRPVRIALAGEPIPEDRSYVRAAARRLGRWTGGVPLSVVDDEAAEVELRFVPPEDYPRHVDGVVPLGDGGPLGWFAAEAGADGRLTGCRALLPAGESVPQYQRLNLILEALVGCLGLAGTAPRPFESVFYAGRNWYEVDFAPVDREVIRLHHAPDLAPGMTRAEVGAALRARLEASGPAYSR